MGYNVPDVAPVLSTPDTNIFEDYPPSKSDGPSRQRSNEQIYITYEIDRTVKEIRRGKWRRVALQFPDHMLSDAPRVSEELSKSLSSIHPYGNADFEILEDAVEDSITHPTDRLTVSSESLPKPRIYILADTSYGACCVDEIAAEHINADVVVHYGRSCLSPTARLPVIYIFTIQPLAVDTLLQAFQETYPDRERSILLMADVSYSSHLPWISENLKSQGYTKIYTTKVVHDPSSPLPNRTVPDIVLAEPERLRNWELFHISNPPESLLLTLFSRVSKIYIFPTSKIPPSSLPRVLLASTALILRKRYALLTSVSTVPVFGILINTLSVKNYLHVVERVKSQIFAAGKKSYTFVVGKVNAAKVANFSEVGAWVVIGCWESSLIESKDFWKPILTPFELDLALQGDHERIWTGEWTSDFQFLLKKSQKALRIVSNGESTPDGPHDEGNCSGCGGIDSEPESVPPEFDLRTGRYVSQSRPMQPYIASVANALRDKESLVSEKSLIKRAKGDLANVGGEISPGAEYLRLKRTWMGLGSDFEIAYDESRALNGTTIEEGSSGIARGYISGDGTN